LSCIGLEIWANNGGGFVGVDVDVIGNQIGGKIPALATANKPPTTTPA
jgi:hypothetical protein